MGRRGFRDVAERVGRTAHERRPRDGRAALEKAKDGRHDLILLDVDMPKLGGFEILKKLRQLGAARRVVMILEEDADESAAQKALNAGADAYIARPVDAKKVLDTVGQALAELRRQQAVTVLLPQLHDPHSGRIDAKKVADFLGVSLQRLAAALEANYQTIYKTPDGPAIQLGLRPMKRVLELISGATPSPSEARAWLNNPHPHLGGKDPIDVILDGRARAIVTMLENALSGIPA